MDSKRSSPVSWRLLPADPVRRRMLGAAVAAGAGALASAPQAFTTDTQREVIRGWFDYTVGGEIDVKKITATAADAYVIVRQGARLEPHRATDPLA